MANTYVYYMSLKIKTKSSCIVECKRETWSKENKMKKKEMKGKMIAQ